MKRLIAFFVVFACLLSSCGTANKAPQKEKGWLQTTFFKNKFGDSYRSVKFRMGQHSHNLSDEKGVLTYVSLDFGGGKWDVIRLYFDDSDKFCKITFEKSFTTEIGASRWYSGVEEELEKKYGEARDLEDGIGYMDNADIMLALRKFQAESRGGELRWYCRLEYTDIQAVLKNSYKVNPDL